MSDNKLVKTITDAATITGFAAAIGWVAKKVVKENDLKKTLLCYISQWQVSRLWLVGLF